MMRRGFFLCVAVCLFVITALKAHEKGTPKVGINDVENLLLKNSEINDNALSKLQLVLNNLTKKQKQYKNERDFVEHLYYFTHRKILKKYDQYASLSATLATGVYDCLTATAVYSILLTELSIPHAVVETNYHIYILVYPDSEGEILLETTDPAYGFITEASKIEHLKSEYKLANDEQEIGQVEISLNIERRLQDKELIGLLFYNQSVNELNQGNWQLAEELAKQAVKFYPNIRITKLIEYIDTSS